jgi:hypothetical protein
MVIKGISSIHRQYEIIFAAESQIANAEWQLPRHWRHWASKIDFLRCDILLPAFADLADHPVIDLDHR